MTRLTILITFSICFCQQTGCVKPHNHHPDSPTAKRESDRKHLRVIRELTSTATGRGHLQGISTDGEHVYWSFASSLVKTDIDGNPLLSVEVEYHHGDLTCHDGKVFVSFMSNVGSRVSKVIVYRSEDLSLIEEHELTCFEDYIGTLDFHDGHFYLAEDFHSKLKLIKVHQFDESFQLVRTHTVDIEAWNGFETIARFGGYWWGSTYAFEYPLVRMDDDFRLLEVFPFGFPYGFKSWDRDTVLTGHVPSTLKWLKYGQTPDGSLQWAYKYEGNTIPDNDGWKRHGSQFFEALDGDLLHYVDDDDTPGEGIAWSRETGCAMMTLEARMRVVSGTGGRFRVSLSAYWGKSDLVLEIQENRVGLGTYPEPTRFHEMDTTDGFHVYRLCVHTHHFMLYIDGQPAIDGRGFGPNGNATVNQIVFGAGSAPGRHEAFIDSLYFNSQGTWAPISADQ